MSAHSLSARMPGRSSKGSRLRQTRVGGGDALAFSVLVAFAIALAAYALANGHELLASLVSVFPIVGWLATRPTIPLLLLGASLPAFMSLTGSGLGSTGGGGYNASLSDFLLILIVAGIALKWISGRSEPVLRALRPVALPVLAYVGVMVIVLSLHLGAREVFKTGQRFELFLLPLIAGAFAALSGRHLQVLRAYVFATTALAVIWPINHVALQKNPVGQMIANAILLLVGVRALRPLFPALVLLVPGLVLTVSRGAIAGAVVGLMTILVLQRTRDRPLLTRVLPLVLLALGAFAFAPPAVQTRVTTFHAGTSTPGQYAIYLRQKYAKDAHQIIAAHPWTGVGIGNYYAADAAISTTPVLDPHQVLLQQEAEGGYLFGVAFVLLIAGTMLALRGMRTVDVGPAAAGVLIATAAHGLVDIYWTRGTPLLGWLVVGMACGGFLKLRNAKLATRPS